MLADDLDALTEAIPAGPPRTVRLVGPYDPYLQLVEAQAERLATHRGSVLGEIAFE